MIVISAVIIEAALARKGSVGAHYRSDYKDRGEGWRKHIRLDKNSLDIGKNRSKPLAGTGC